jgi:hypothetical protein
MIVTIENDRTGDAVTLEALRALLQPVATVSSQSEEKRAQDPSSGRVAY